MLTASIAGMFNLSAEIEVSLQAKLISNQTLFGHSTLGGLVGNQSTHTCMA